MINDTFSKRLKEERKRKGFNQADFAALGGVKKLSQLQYEKGERLPSLEYIAELWRSDEAIDVGYILTGKRTADQYRMEESLWRILTAMEDWLSLIQYEDEFIRIINLAMEEVKMETPGTKTYYEVRSLLSKSPNVMLTSSDLEEVVDRVEFVLEAMGRILDSRSKASLFFHVYQTFKTQGGRIDLKMIEDAIQQVS